MTREIVWSSALIPYMVGVHPDRARGILWAQEWVLENLVRLHYAIYGGSIYMVTYSSEAYHTRLICHVLALYRFAHVPILCSRLRTGNRMHVIHGGSAVSPRKNKGFSPT
jgi:hypothetical protein